MNKFSFLTLSAILLSSTALASKAGHSDDSNLPGDVDTAVQAFRSAGAHVEERLHTFYTAVTGDDEARKKAHDDLPVSVRQLMESSSEAAGHVAQGARGVAASVSDAFNRAATAIANEAGEWNDAMTAQYRSSSPTTTAQTTSESASEGAQETEVLLPSRPSSPSLLNEDTVEDAACHEDRVAVTSTEDTSSGDASTTATTATTSTGITATEEIDPSRPSTPVTNTSNSVADPETYEEKGAATLIDGENPAHEDAATSARATTDVSASPLPNLPVTTSDHTTENPESIEGNEQVVPTFVEGLPHSDTASTASAATDNVETDAPRENSDS